MTNPLWFKDAVIYQVHVKSFHDSNGDGVGDFGGLLEKLDYFTELGVTAVWLLPFYPSPQRDDGYDISDYYSVHPSYGTLEDFRRFLREAHARGIRVITELVINHTSDQNPWFQVARRAKPGSPERDFYVWSDTPNRYADARIIFKDFEASNWSWDPVAKAYFWHRFYHHQPDLNFDNLAVHQAVTDVLDFWFDMGVDGLRLDAVPYLYEREGTNCENLPETHAFLKKLRAHMDVKYPGRMLLAEANQWPEDAAAYFGDGDECHMNFHFPIMPRLFMSLQMEDRFPIVDILEQTPAIPANCQWATFLRNHDELTLEMVTDEERDYMYRVYAEDQRARINLGIRRRLAPLMGNNRRRIELINALLFSLPGTPIVYYGDEIGMGDNFYLGDRNGVRTPMQWAPDRNGGFSKANPQQLFLPTIIDPEYHFEAVNVENQRRNLSSLFWWMRRLIAERKRWKAFGHGTIRFLHPKNAKVLAFVREFGEETLLVVANLSRFTQATELDLTEFAGVAPTEIFSRNGFPELRHGGNMFTLGPHDFYWLALRRPGVVVQRPETPEPKHVELDLNWRAGFGPDVRETLERDLLPAYLEGCAWFDAAGRRLREVRIIDARQLGEENDPARLLLVQVSFAEGLPETYILPLKVSVGREAETVKKESPHSVVGIFRRSAEAEEQVLHDAALDAGFRAALLELVATGEAGSGPLLARHGRGFQRETVLAAAANSQVISLERSNSSIAFNNEFFLKLYRRLDWGRPIEAEQLRYLSETKQFPAAAPYVGSLVYTTGAGQTATVALLQGYVQNQGDAWSYTVDAVGRFFERLLAARPEPGDMTGLVEAIGAVNPERTRQLGQRLAEYHLALSSDPDHSAFAPEPFTTLYQRSLYQAVRGNLRRTIRLLGEHRAALPEQVRGEADFLIQEEATLLERYGGLLRRKIEAAKTAVHGSFHLAQVLNTGKDFVIVDLEGDPTRPLSERNLKRSPLVDVASLLRSLDHAAHAALLKQQPTDAAWLESWTDAWVEHASGQFVAAYMEIARTASFLPKDETDLKLLLDVFVLDRALLELSRDLAQRPQMALTSIRAMCRLSDISRADVSAAGAAK